MDSSEGTLYFRTERSDEYAILGQDEEPSLRAKVEVGAAVRLVALLRVRKEDDAADERAVLVPDLTCRTTLDPFTCKTGLERSHLDSVRAARVDVAPPVHLDAVRCAPVREGEDALVVERGSLSREVGTVWRPDDVIHVSAYTKIQANVSRGKALVRLT